MSVLKFLWGLLINLDILLIVGMLVGVFLLFSSAPQRGRRILVRCLIPFLIIGYTPVGRWIMTHQELRFPEIKEVPSDVDGFILLGGSFGLIETPLWEKPIYNKASSRLFEFIALVQKYPGKRIIVTGTPVESDYTRKVFDMFGVDQSRVTYEGNSRNTQDNAKLTYELVKPNPNSKWVLVTSAFHIPRSVGLFKGAGWTVIPYPVNYMSTGEYGKHSWLAGLDRMNFAAWRMGILQVAGLVNHYLEGDSKVIYPKPS